MSLLREQIIKEWVTYKKALMEEFDGLFEPGTLTMEALANRKAGFLVTIMDSFLNKRPREQSIDPYLRALVLDSLGEHVYQDTAGVPPGPEGSVN